MDKSKKNTKVFFFYLNFFPKTQFLLKFFKSYVKYVLESEHSARGRRRGERA